MFVITYVNRGPWVVQSHSVYFISWSCLAAVTGLNLWCYTDCSTFWPVYQVNCTCNSTTFKCNKHTFSLLRQKELDIIIFNATANYIELFPLYYFSIQIFNLLHCFISNALFINIPLRSPTTSAFSVSDLQPTVSKLSVL